MMTRSVFLRYIILFFILFVPFCTKNMEYDTEALQGQFTDLRFGMFLHFGIRTFTGGAWGEANQDITRFEPGNLDCGQWADAAVSAHMKCGILTTKHHDGFCLWNSDFTDYDVGSVPWRQGEGDVVMEYVNAFRSRGLEPCLYYSIWDNTAGIGNGPVTEAQMEIIEGQLTEILSNYGEIKMLFIDGWSWKMGHVEVPYPRIRELVKSLQPRCLLIDNTHLPCLYDNDLIHYEAGGECPSDNTLPALLSRLIYTEGGNSWFWAPDIPVAELLTAASIQSDLEYLEARWCTYILNCPPNTDGLLDTSIVLRLAEAGEIWSPDLSRPPLPRQQPQIKTFITPAAAVATSGIAANAIDGKNDRFYYSVWKSSDDLPQSLTLDLGGVHNINMVYIVPNYIPVVKPLEQGSIQSYRLYASRGGIEFTMIDEGEWAGDTKMKVAVFESTEARFIRLEVLSAVDDFAAVTEIAVGRSDFVTPVENFSAGALPGLIQNFPNPFNPQTAIRYTLTESDAHVQLCLFNVIGQHVRTLVNEMQSAGSHLIYWNGTDQKGLLLKNGIYEIRIVVTGQRQEYQQSRKMIMMR
jgi:alpha-L-fucosidase